MKLKSDQDMATWLETMDFQPSDFDWDKGNLEKNYFKHNVSKEEIESILLMDFIFIGEIIEPIHSEWRGLILGVSNTSKFLALIFTRRENKFRVISCRSMRKQEMKIYHEKITYEN